MIFNIRNSIRKNIANIPGWRTNRKIVVIESDDWGSIRMSSKYSYEKLLIQGYPLDESHYCKFDALESNEDLKLLYQVLSQYQDKKSRAPVFTAVSIVGNPDFEKIMSLLKYPVVFDGRNVYSLEKMEELGYPVGTVLPEELVQNLKAKLAQLKEK